jgi:hypothetical protein
MLDTGRRNHRWPRHTRRDELLQPGGTQDGTGLVRAAAQHELDSALCARQLQLLGIFWSEQHRDHIDLLWLALRIWFYGLTRCQDFNILQYGLGERSTVASRRGKRHQHVHLGSGIQEARYTDEFIGSDRGCAHSGWYFSGEPDSGSFDAQVPQQDGFLSRKRVQQGSPDDQLNIGEGASRRGIRVPVIKSHVICRESRTHRQVCLRYNNLDRLMLLGIVITDALIKKIRDAPGKQRSNGKRC